MNLEPNTLLIIIGSIFILLGLAGHIVIEKFSVSLAALPARATITILGAVLLTFGIVGPHNILPNKQDNALKQAEKPDVVVKERPQEKAINSMEEANKKKDLPEEKTKPVGIDEWFNQVSGSYYGYVDNRGKLDRVVTTLYLDNKGKLKGTYVMGEDEELALGELYEFKSEQRYTAEFTWKDKYGTGRLRIEFSPDLLSFSGNWGRDVYLHEYLTWTGSK